MPDCGCRRCWRGRLRRRCGGTCHKALTTRGDGSRTPAVHRIPLYCRGRAGQAGRARSRQRRTRLCRSPCGARAAECHIYKHDYDVIKKGWHFNATDANVPAGRPGQPWIYVDAATGTQIPLSYRAWPGTFRPDQVGMSPFRFTQLFGRHMPGGGPGEIDTKNRRRDSPADRLRQAGDQLPELPRPGPGPRSGGIHRPGRASRTSAGRPRPRRLSRPSAARPKEMDDTFDSTMPDTVTDAEAEGRRSRP